MSAPRGFAGQGIESACRCGPSPGPAGPGGGAPAWLCRPVLPGLPPRRRVPPTAPGWRHPAGGSHWLSAKRAFKIPLRFVNNQIAALYVTHWAETDEEAHEFAGPEGVWFVNMAEKLYAPW